MSQEQQEAVTAWHEGHPGRLELEATALDPLLDWIETRTVTLERSGASPESCAAG